MNKNLKNQIKDALNNNDLQRGLKKAIKNFKQHRSDALENIDFKLLQTQLKAIKEKNLNQLDKNIEKFKLSCQKNGLVLYEATNQDDACNKILEIIKYHNGKKLVKAKSMVSEEIELNDFLTQNGIDPIETDLGEWLVQLAGEKPSHITAPAIHMTKEKIAALLKQKFNIDIQPDATEITAFAKKKLRKEFIDADIGLTGANILIADTGSIIIVSNEGNARLVSTLPDVHIVLTTYEKIVETMIEAQQILDILPKSATGQTITSYVSIISGPSKTADVEKELVIGVHGPKYIYIVLLDNGRKSILENPDFKEALNCIKCGACLGMCPVYQTVGGHVFGRKYMGGIGAVLTAFIENIENSADLTKLCSGCGICKDICPVAIDIPRMTLKLKELLASSNKLSLAKKLLVKSLFYNKAIFNNTLVLASGLQKLLFNTIPEFSQLPKPLSPLTQFRNLPKFANKSFTQLATESKVFLPFDENKKSLLFFSGCLIEFIYPEFGLKAVNLLQDLGFNVIFPEKQTCCGIPALYSGETKIFEYFNNENSAVINQYKDKDLEGIITICPSCTKGLQQGLSTDNLKVFDLSEVLYNTILNSSLPVKTIDNFTYHPSCHYAKDQNYKTYTHLLLKHLYTDRFIEHYDMNNCCGASGGYAIEFPDISEKIVARKVKNIVDSGAKNLIVDCPGCFMQFKGYVNKQNIPINLLFITDIFATPRL